VFSCDYNGWTDVPEEEREAIDIFESGCRAPAHPPLPYVSLLPLPSHPFPPRLKAA
jgi:hypothetical protein